MPAGAVALGAPCGSRQLGRGVMGRLWPAADTPAERVRSAAGGALGGRRDVALLHEEAAGGVVDDAEAAGAEERAPEPPGHHHAHPLCPRDLQAAVLQRLW